VEGPPQGAAGAALNEDNFRDTAIPEVPLSQGPSGETPLPPGDENL